MTTPIPLIQLGSAKRLTLGGPSGPAIEPNMQPTRVNG
jgi:hypothetical protein